MKLVVSKYTRPSGEIFFLLNLVDCDLDQQAQMKLYKDALEKLNAKQVNRSFLGFDGFVNDYLIGTSMVELSDTNWGVSVESTEENVINQMKAFIETNLTLKA